MKKLTIAFVALLILTGCGSAKIKPVTDEVLFKVKDRQVTEKDLFNAAHSSNAGYSLVRVKAQEILLNKIVEEDDAFKTAVDKKLKEVKESLGENFDLLLKQYGLKSEEEYVEQYLKIDVKLDIALRKAMNDDYDKLKDLRPREVRIVEVEQPNGKKALELAKAGVDFEKIAKDYGKKTSQLKGQVMLVSEITQLDEKALNILLNADKVGVIEELGENATASSNFIFEIVELDTDKLKDKAIDSFIQDNKLADEYLGKLFRANKFKVYDKGIHDAFTENNPNYIK